MLIELTTDHETCKAKTYACVVQHLLQRVRQTRIPPQPRKTDSLSAAEFSGPAHQHHSGQAEIREEVGQNRRNGFRRIAGRHFVAGRRRTRVLYRLII